MEINNKVYQERCSTKKRDCSCHYQKLFLIETENNDVPIPSVFLLQEVLYFSGRPIQSTKNKRVWFYLFYVFISHWIYLIS